MRIPLNPERRRLYADSSLATEPFILTGRARPKRVEGYPIDALSVDISTGRYFYDLPGKTPDQSAVELGFRAFLEDVLRNRKHNPMTGGDST